MCIIKIIYSHLKVGVVGYSKNTINLKRKFVDLNGRYDEDILEICSPGTETVKKGNKKKKKKN